MTWWITVSTPGYEREITDSVFRLDATQEEVEALAAEINAINNDSKAVAHDCQEAMTVEGFHYYAAFAFEPIREFDEPVRI